MTKSESSTSDRAGLWSAVSKAVAGGWGATARLLVILLTIGGIVIVSAVAVGAGASGGAPGRAAAHPLRLLDFRPPGAARPRRSRHGSGTSPSRAPAGPSLMAQDVSALAAVACPSGLAQ